MRQTRPVKRRRNNDTGADSDLVPSLPTTAQKSSPLFSVLPAEIRNRIYEFSLESGDSITADDNHSLYRRNALYYRPGYQQPKRIQTALLQTCRQAYNEASLLPPALNEHTFWFYRPPPHVKDASWPLGYFRRMTKKQRAQVHHVHLFTQQYFLEDNNWSRIWEGLVVGTDGRSLRGECRIAPKKMTITLRHTDWWFWEDNYALGIDPFREGRTPASEMGTPAPPFVAKRAWGNQFTSIPSLEELVIEFETVMRKKDQLDDIVQRALQWKFPVQAEKSVYLVADPSSKSAYTWVGANEGELKSQRRPTNAEKFQQSQAEFEQGPAHMAPQLKPLVVQSSSRTDETSRPEFGAGKEEFYVVFVTWRRSIVEL